MAKHWLREKGSPKGGNMKKILYLLFKYLPAIILVAMVFLPTEAYAQFGFVKKILGIDTVDNCLAPLAVEKHVCYFCGMFEIIFNSAAKVASLSYQAFHTDLGQLIIIFLAVSLALITLRNVASMGTQDPGALMNMLASRIFVCAAIYYIITRDYYNILNITITPILIDGLGLIGNTPPVTVNLGNIGGFDIVAGALGGDTMPRAIGQIIVSSINNIENKIQDLFEYGRWAMCLGNGPERLFHVIPNPLMVVDGILLYIGGILFLVGYPWIMADAVIQLGISLALLPFALAGYAFSGTKQYLSKLFNWILHSLFVFIFMGILISCILDYIHDIIWDAIRVHSDPSALFLNPVTGLAFYGVNMVKIIFALAIGWMYMPEIRDLAENFSSGSGLTAASKVGTSVTEPINKAAEKMGDHAAQAAGRVTASTAHIAERKVRATARQTMKAAVNTLGTDMGGGRRTFKIPGGRFTGNMEFTTVKNPDGTTYLRREFTSITGRKHVMISDKYSTIKQEYDRDGNLIKNEVKFKHNFLKEHLIDQEGKFNVGAVETLMHSNIAQDPAYKEAIMAQLAVEAMKKKGMKVGTYFSSRTVHFDPANPGKIFVEQVDHNGKKTLFDLNINMTTGQYLAAYDQDLKRTHPLHEWERGMRIGVHNVALGGGRKKTLFGEYEMKVDPSSGELYYTRTRKKWILFGPKVEKDFYKNKTVKRKQASAETITKQRDNAAKIARKLRHVVPVGGKRTRKTLFHTYESYINGHGQMVYTKKLRKGWNIKNYYRGAAFTGGLAMRVPLAIATTALNLPVTFVHQIFQPKESAKALKYFGNAGRGLLSAATWTTGAGAKAELANIGQGLAHTILGRTIIESGKDFWKGGNIKKTLDSRPTFQTGNPVNITDSGKTVTDSATGATLSTSLKDETVERTLDGNKTATDNITGEKSTQAKEVGRRTMKFFGTFGEIEIDATLDSNNNVVGEKTKYTFSEQIQEGHDHFTYQYDGNQVVEDSGRIAPDLLATLGGNPNPNHLMFGFNEVFGKSTIASMSTEDFFVNAVFAEGRRRRTNKMRTNISSLLI